MRTKSIFVLVIVALLSVNCVFMARPACASTYETWGRLIVDTYHGGEVERVQGPVACPQLYDGEVAHPEEYAMAKYRADLTTGTLTARAEGESAYYDCCNWSLFRGDAKVWVSFEEMLYFHIPDGNYPDGVYVTLYGRADGLLHARGNNMAAAQGSYEMKFWSANDVNLISSEILEVKGANDPYHYDDRNCPVNDPLALRIAIVPAGTTLTESSTVEAYISGNIGTNGVLSIAAASGEQQGVADAHLRIQVMSVDVPPGIEWTSASGVFLSCLPADIDNDGDVDFFDFALLAAAWQSRPGGSNWNPACDIAVPADNVIDMNDLLVLTEHWLQTSICSVEDCQ